MSLFRKNALDALNTPEHLDQPMQLLRPSYWTLLISLLVFSTSLLLWSIFGRLPVRINGQGVLLRTESLQDIQSGSTGHIEKLYVKEGDCVRRGDPLARIESTQQDLEIYKSKNQLQLLLGQDSSEVALARVRESELQQQLARVQGLARSGAMSKDELANRRQQLIIGRIEIEARKNQRQLQIQEQRNQIRNLEKSIQITSIIRAPRAGCVVDRHVKVGEVVQTGVTLFELESASTTQTLQSMALFPAGDGKRLKPGQRVQITPASTNAQRHGGIEGRILSIRKLPVSEAALKSRLGNSAWMKLINTKSEGPLIEVVTSLQRKSSTVSGYDWGGGDGPNIQLSAGTPTSVRVLVEERQPISYLIPILRDLSGIY